jgi:hypothetical protein
MLRVVGGVDEGLAPFCRTYTLSRRGGTGNGE